ncbi:MAG: crotonase/enoyl-CoA hydratase family protein [Dehalococcoidia bacterium]
MNYQQIAYEVEDRILTITLDRPEKLNAFTDQMKDELIDAMNRADADDEVRAVIVTGRGRGFCAGADLSSGAGTFDNATRGRTDDPDEHRDGGGQWTLRIYESKKPVIAAINGPAVGVGVTMTLAMDVRLAADNARFGFVFARRGLVPEAASTWFLPRAVGMSQALEWAFSGRVFSAQEALAGGLVRSLHPQDELMAKARELASEIALNTSAVSVAMTRQMMWRNAAADHPMQAHRVDSKGIFYLGKGPDAHEGVASFLEKRAPNFTMSPTKDMPPHFPWWQDPPFRP